MYFLAKHGDQSFLKYITKYLKPCLINIFSITNSDIMELLLSILLAQVAMYILIRKTVG